MSNGYNEDSFLPEQQLPLAELCTHINAKVTAFLETEPKDEAMRRVQDQTRISLNVIDEALKRYE